MHRILLLIVAAFVTTLSFSSKLVYITTLDQEYIHLYFQDGEVVFVDDGLGACAHDHCNEADNSELISFGSPLSTAASSNTTSWLIKSNDDPAYGTIGQNPTDVYRKSKLNAMSQEAWSGGDYQYDWAYEHHIFLKVPHDLIQGSVYTVEINSGVNSDITSSDVTFDIYTQRSEAVKVNVVGYSTDPSIKAADLYMWLGDGGARDYSSYVGNKVYIYDVNSEQSTEVGSVSLWQNEATETNNGHHMTQSDVWSIDFTGFETAGTYRLVVEGVGCSDDFTIDSDVYKSPFEVSLKGFFYMRIGQDNLGMVPIPRRPLWIPDNSPNDTKVYLTTMHPYHPQWGTFAAGDAWDQPSSWIPYVESGSPTNANAYGGHSDALDWDRRLQHVSIIYDMLLPYILTGGAQDDDNTGIAESNNGIPDLLDEAQNEVDFWLRLRDQNGGYSHGLTNPIKATHALYQAGATAMAAWANAANSAMLSASYKLAGETTLMELYRDSAVSAYNYALTLPDQQLNETQPFGSGDMTGRQFRAMAAGFLYTVTGNTAYEDDVAAQSAVTSGSTDISLGEIYPVAAYLMTDQAVSYPTLYGNMESSVIASAKTHEADYSLSRPSRRSTDNSYGWFQTQIFVNRTLVAHAIAPDGADKDLFTSALILEADYSLGRNPMSRIMMTTATTDLAGERSIENAYTSGWDDGTEGVHPGHTPYMNPFDWGGLIMGRPEWMSDKNYPNAYSGNANPANLQWPMGEMYYNTRFVYSHCEFTPQQTMRGKMALYAYLHGLGPSCASPNLGADVSICGLSSLVLDAGLPSAGRTFTWEKDGVVIPNETGNTLLVTEAGTYTVHTDESGCTNTADIEVLDILPSFSLGNDIDLCTPSDVVLYGPQDAGLSYQWYRDGFMLNDQMGDTLRVTMPGSYELAISAALCDSESDMVMVTSSLLDVQHDTLCTGGAIDLIVNGAGSYEWFESLDDVIPLGAGNNLTVNVTQDEVFYVEDNSGISANVGKVAPGANTWGAFTESYQHMYKFTVHQGLTIESVDVYAQSAGNIHVVLYDENKTQINSLATTVAGTGLETIVVNFALTPGVYHLNAEGSDANLVMDNNTNANFSYPFDLPAVVTIDGTDPSWVGDQPWWLHFYNWKVVSGNTCARTPLSVVVDGSNSNCTVTSVNSEVSETNFAIPNPTTGMLYLDKVSSWSLHSMQGKILSSGKGETVDLTGFKSGVYVLSFKSGQRTKVRKL